MSLDRVLETHIFEDFRKHLGVIYKIQDSVAFLVHLPHSPFVLISSGCFALLCNLCHSYQKLWFVSHLVLSS